MSQSKGRWLLWSALYVSLCVHAGGSNPIDSNKLPQREAPPQRIPDVPRDTSQPRGTPVATARMPKEVRRAVVADAARRFQVAESAVVLARAEQLTWSDGSLGCPQPGMMYTQALVPGYRVTATTAEGQMLYHADTRGNFATCAQTPRSSPEQAPAKPGKAPTTGAEPPNQPPGTRPGH